MNVVILLLIVINYSCDNKTDEPTTQLVIPNGDFEEWALKSELLEPVDWNTSNFNLYNIVSFNTVTKDSLNAYSGKYCPRLETKSQIVNGETVKVAGLITLGVFDVNIETRQAVVFGGIGIESKPTSLEGYFKYSAVGVDSCFIDIALTKQEDTVANARFSSSSTPDWTSFNIPIKYRSEETPDSINIVILSSDTSIFEAGSTLWIDNLTLNY